MPTMQQHPVHPPGTDNAPALSRWRVGLLGPLLAAMTAGSALAQADAELVSLINDYRSQVRSCGGKNLPAAGPVAPHAGLAKVRIDGGGDLRAALREQGYLPARFQAISVTGPASARATMDVIAKSYCAPLMDPGYADIGVSREGANWRIVLARPVLSPDLGDWSQAGREVLKLANEARSERRTCGSQAFSAAPALTWSQGLGAAALAHSRDMATQNYFSHRAKDGSDAGARVDRQGYGWRNVGENIAAGQGSAKQAIAAWLASPSHCANLMNPAFTEMGAAYAVDEKSDRSIYWTQVFAAPR